MSGLDPMAMLLDAARFIEGDKPAWAKAAREAVKAFRRAPTVQEPDLRSALHLLDSLDRIAEDFKAVEPCRHNNDNIISDLKIELAGLREALTVTPSTATGDDWHAGYKEGMHDARAIDAAFSPSTAMTAEPSAWEVWFGIGEMTRGSDLFRSREAAEKIAAQIKSNTEIRPLYAAPPSVAPVAGGKEPAMTGIPIEYTVDAKGDIQRPSGAPFDGTPVLIKLAAGWCEAYWEDARVGQNQDGTTYDGFCWVYMDGEGMADLDDVKLWAPLPDTVPPNSSTATAAPTLKQADQGEEYAILWEERA